MVLIISKLLLPFWLLDSQDLRTQLARERESSHQSTLHKDVEAQELRNRLDRAVSSWIYFIYLCWHCYFKVDDLSKTRESLVRAETTRTHLQERLNELEKQIQSAEEKLAVYERRPGGSSLSANSSLETVADPQMQRELAELRFVFLTCWEARLLMNLAEEHWRWPNWIWRLDVDMWSSSGK